MKSLVVLALLVSHTPPVAAQGQVHVYTHEVRVAPGGAPQEFTLECQPRESVLSGGFSHNAPEMRVLASFPSPARPAWSVTAVNPGRAPLALTVSVVCASGEVTSSVKLVTGNEPALAVQCPDRTVVTGGGYSSGTWAIVSSYPAVGEGWAVSAVPPAETPDTVVTVANVTVYAVCAAGAIRPAGAGSAEAVLTPGAARCAPSCVHPRQGSEAVACEGSLVGGGYEMIGQARPPVYAVTSAWADKDLWKVVVNGQTANDRPLSVRMVAICAFFPSAAMSEVPVNVDPIAQRDDMLPIVATTCLLSALALAFILVMSARLRSRARARKAPQATIAVVLTSHHSSFRMEELREIP